METIIEISQDELQKHAIRTFLERLKTEYSDYHFHLKGSNTIEVLDERHNRLATISKTGAG